MVLINGVWKISPTYNCPVIFTVVERGALLQAVRGEKGKERVPVVLKSLLIGLNYAQSKIPKQQSGHTSKVLIEISYKVRLLKICCSVNKNVCVCNEEVTGVFIKQWDACRDMLVIGCQAQLAVRQLQGAQVTEGIDIPGVK